METRFSVGRGKKDEEGVILKMKLFLAHEAVCICLILLHVQHVHKLYSTPLA